MEFEKVLEHFNQGSNIRRRSWEKGLFLGRFKAVPGFMSSLNDGDMCAYMMVCDEFYIDCTKMNECIYKIEGDEKPYKFYEVISALKRGKKVTSDQWKKDAYVQLLKDGNSMAIFYPEQRVFNLPISCLSANDWETV